MNIVITMGGLGKRFVENGYTEPKYMIVVRGKTLFEWSLLSLEGYKENSKYIFVVRNVASYDVKSFISKKCEELSISNYEIVVLDYLTDGQATTVIQAKNCWDWDQELLIYNIDTYVEPYEMRYSNIKGDGFIPCFVAEGDHWSFVKIDDSGKAIQVAEKKRISENCSLGAYYFKNCKLFYDLYNEFYDDNRNLTNGEKYVAPIYNMLIEKGGDVYIEILNSDKVHILGTPKELEDFINLSETIIG